MEYANKRLDEILANPPKAPDVSFDELLAPREATELPAPLLPGRTLAGAHRR